MHKKLTSILVILIIFILLLTACGGGNEAAEPDANTIITQAVETAMAALTQTAMFEPSPTFTVASTLEPSPTFTNTVVVPTSAPAATQAVPQSGAGLSSCDLAAFVEDVTIPDGTELLPGQNFTKIWRISNEGSCTWTSEYQILYFGGEILSAETAYQLTSTDVAPGDTLDISIEMTAPSATGSYTMWWIMRNADGQNFGVDASGGAIYVQIAVSSSAATTTPASTATATVQATTEVPSETPTETPTPTDTTTP